MARETVSLWMHHDPVFIAELQNTRSAVSGQTRSALEAIGKVEQVRRGDRGAAP